MTGWNIASALAGFIIGVIFCVNAINEVEKRNADRGYAYIDSLYFQLVPVVPTPPEEKGE